MILTQQSSQSVNKLLKSLLQRSYIPKMCDALRAIVSK